MVVVSYTMRGSIIGMEKTRPVLPIHPILWGKVKPFAHCLPPLLVACSIAIQHSSLALTNCSALIALYNLQSHL